MKSFVTNMEYHKQLLQHNKGKVGASVLKISDLKPSKKHAFESNEKVKGKEFELFLDRA